MLVAQRPTIEEVNSAKNDRQKFSIGPLEPGFGFTLGNSLRRILLSSLGGAAITSIKFQGVFHEFSTIDGVEEDVIDIVLNLKDIVVKSYTDEAVTITLEEKAEGKGETIVTAKALDKNSNIEILNPDQQIATLHSGATLAADITIDNGRGYVPAGSTPQTDIGQISIDAIFSPIRRVSLSVEPIQVEESTEYDLLVLDIQTDGTVTPRDAIASAAATLKELSILIEEFGENPEGLTFEEVKEEEPKELLRSILELELSERAQNCLLRAEITTLDQLIKSKPSELLQLTNFGAKSLTEVEEKLENMGLALTGDDASMLAASAIGAGEADLSALVDIDETIMEAGGDQAGEDV